MAANVETILSRIRAVGICRTNHLRGISSHEIQWFTGQLQPPIYQDILPVLLRCGWNGAGVGSLRIATEPYGRNSCGASLLITLANGTCNVRPTASGPQSTARIIAEMVPPQ